LINQRGPFLRDNKILKLDDCLAQGTQRLVDFTHLPTISQHRIALALRVAPCAFLNYRGGCDDIDGPAANGYSYSISSSKVT
jgi:hypothetical protein